MTNITYAEFEKIDIRLGTITKVEDFERARKPAYKIWTDFGSEVGTLQTSAQVTIHYTKESLISKRIIGCINLGEKNIAGFTSQFLLFGFADNQGAICLATIDEQAPDGAKLC